MKSFLLTFLVLLSSSFAFCQDWNIERSSATQSKFSYTAQEGTWISLDISPDGEFIVFDLLGHLYQMPINGGEAKPLTAGKSFNAFPRYSPDGKKLLYTSDLDGSEDLWVMDLETGLTENVSQMSLPVFQGTWSKDGRHIYGTALNTKVRFPYYQFNFFGTRQELIPAGDREPINHMTYHPSQDHMFYEHNVSGDIYGGGGPQIKLYNTYTGESTPYIRRRGGAASPRISPDGAWLSYIRRNDQKTELIIHHLETREEKVVHGDLDWGRFESRSFYGCYSNYAWHPNNREIFISFDGKIQAIHTETGVIRKVPFTARVERNISQTHRAKIDFDSEGSTQTRSHRWGIKTPKGIIYEALGDLYLKNSEGEIKNLTNSPTHETSPVYDAASQSVYFGAWSDKTLGDVHRMPVEGGEIEKLTSQPAQIGAIAISDHGQVAYIRGAGGIKDGQHLEGQTEFEIALVKNSGATTKITDLTWTWNRYGKRPPTLMWGGDHLYFTEYVGDALTLKKINQSGTEEHSLYVFPHATRAVVSPDFQWIVFREYHRNFITPFEFAGKTQRISAADRLGFTQRVDINDGDFTEWAADSKSLFWTRGKFFIEKRLTDILASSETVNQTDLTIEYSLSVPESVIAFRNVRVLTMNKDMDVLQNATVLIEGNRIKEVGRRARIPSGAKVYNLRGYTIMPGMFDAHGHYGSPISATNTIEQKHYGLLANLAYGVTTTYDVYGTTQKDFWLDDMTRSGKMIGSRIWSVGDPVFVTKYRTKMHRPITSLDDALEIARFNKAHGATALKDYSNHTRKARQHLIEASRVEGLNLVTESFSNPQMNITQIIDGFTGIEHTMGVSPLYDDVIQLFAHTQIGMTPTLIVVYNGVSGENYFYNSERIWENKKLLNFYRKDELLRHRRPTKYFEDDYYHMDMAREMKKLHDAGVLLQMGAHGQKMGIGAHWEMEMFVHGGFSPLEAIQIATINGFKHHGLDHALGSIEEGKLADLVILRKNPLENIRNTREIEYVMKNGQLYDGDDAHPVYPINGETGRMYFGNK